MRQTAIAIAAILCAFLTLTGCRTHLIASESTTEKETTIIEQCTDSTSQTKQTADSIRWITRTRDSVNVYRMIVLTQDSDGNVTGTHDVERTYVWHSTEDSTAAYRKQLEALVSERNALRDSLSSQKQTSQQTKEKENLYEEIAAKAFPVIAGLLALSMILNYGLIRRATT